MGVHWELNKASTADKQWLYAARGTAVCLSLEKSGQERGPGFVIASYWTPPSIARVGTTNKALTHTHTHKPI